MYQINRNFSGSKHYSEKSFIGIFHEDELWDDKEYFLLEEEVFALCEQYSGDKCLPREVVWPVMRIFSYLMLTLGCQYDPDDYFNLSNLSHEQYISRRERIQLVFEGFFLGKMPNKKHLEY